MLLTSAWAAAATLSHWPNAAGFDSATAGIAQAKAAATARKLPLVALVAIDDEFEYGEATWDLVVLT